MELGRLKEDQLVIKHSYVINIPDKLVDEVWEDELMANTAVRGTRLLSDIYKRCNVVVCEPSGYIKAKENKNWMDAMKEELSKIKKNKTWDIVDRPHNKKVIGVKWVFRTKLNPDGSVNKHKARLVVKGYAQVFRVDYLDTFISVSRLDTIKLLLAIAA